VLHKTLIALAAAAALGCVPVATNALATSHPDNHANARHAAVAGHATDRHAMTGHPRSGHVVRYGGRRGIGPIYNGPIYDSCPGYGGGYGYGYGGCSGYGGVVGGLIGGVLGGYGPF